MNEITTLPQTPAVTMTSLEIVDVINSSRKLRKTTDRLLRES